MTKSLLSAAVAALALLAGTAFAADTGCADQAATKKLAGAAKNSFVKKCSTDEAASAAK